MENISVLSRKNVFNFDKNYEKSLVEGGNEEVGMTKLTYIITLKYAENIKNLKFQLFILPFAHIFKNN